VGILEKIAGLTFQARVIATLASLVLVATGGGAVFLLSADQPQPLPPQLEARAATGALGSVTPQKPALEPASTEAAAAHPGTPFTTPAGPGVSLSCQSYQGGSDITKNCTVKSRSGFSGEVQLGCAGNPSSISCVFEPPVVTVSSGGSAISKLTLQPQNVPSGSYKFRAVASAGSVSSSFALSWKADNPAGSGYPLLKCPGMDQASTPHNTKAGGQVEVRCALESSYGYGGPVRLTCSSALGPISCTPVQPELNLSPHEVVPAVFVVSVPKGMQSGVFRFEVTYSGPGAAPVVRTPTTFYVRSTPPNLEVTCSPRDVVMEAGSIGTTSCRLTSSDGFNEEVGLMVNSSGPLIAELSRTSARVGDEFQVRFSSGPGAATGPHEFVLGYAWTEPKLFHGSYTVVPGPQPAG
jgi:hypothetical protein